MINGLIQEFDSKNLLNKIKSNKLLTLDVQGNKYDILPEELIVQEVAEDGYSVNYNKDIIVGVATEISDELKDEGMIRDLIRQVQNLRKESGLKVEDRIQIGIMASDDLQKALRSHESYFMNEVLGVKLQLDDASSLKYNQKVKINGKNIAIGISPAN